MFQPGSRPHRLHSQHSQPARMELKGFIHLSKVGCALPSLPAAEMTLKRKRTGVKNPCMRNITIVCLYLMYSNVTAIGHERRSREDPPNSLECSCTLPTASWGALLDGEPRKCDKYCCLEYLTIAPKDQTIPCQERWGMPQTFPSSSFSCLLSQEPPPSCCPPLLHLFPIPELDWLCLMLNTKYQRVFQVWREES